MTVPLEMRRRYQEAFNALLKAYSDVKMMRRAMELGGDAAFAHLLEQDPELIIDAGQLDLVLAYTEETFVSDRADLNSNLEMAVSSGLAEAHVSNKVSSTRVAADGASLLFMHSVFDGTISTRCAISQELRPVEWRLLTRTRRRRRGAEIFGRIAKLTYDCGPITVFEPVTGFDLKVTEIERIELMTSVHDRTQRGSSARDLASVAKDLWYLAAAGLFYCGLVSRTHGVRFMD